MKRAHDLKVWPEHYRLIVQGRKPWELRRHDRDFQKGDWLRLREWDPQTRSYTGYGVNVEVREVTPGPLATGMQKGDLLLPAGVALLTLGEPEAWMDVPSAPEGGAP